jgi:hypothetical protein
MNGRIWGTLAVLALALGPARAAEVERCLPNGAELVLFLNVRQLLDAPVVVNNFLPEYKAAWERDGFKPRALAQLLKFDPFKDIASITVASPVKDATEKALVIVRGRFDIDTIQTAAEIYANRGADDFKAHKQNELRYYEIKEPRSGHAGFLAFLDRETLVMSPSRDAVLDAAARHRGKKAPQPGKELAALLGKIDGKQTLWLAAVMTDDLKNHLNSQLNNAPLRKLTDAVQSIHGGITIGDGIRGDILIQTSDARAASEIRKLLEGIKSLAGLAVTDPDSNRLGTLPPDLVNALKLASDKEMTTIKIAVSSEQIEKSLKTKP